LDLLLGSRARMSGLASEGRLQLSVTSCLSRKRYGTVIKTAWDLSGESLSRSVLLTKYLGDTPRTLTHLACPNWRQGAPPPFSTVIGNSSSSHGLVESHLSIHWSILVAPSLPCDSVPSTHLYPAEDAVDQDLVSERRDGAGLELITQLCYGSAIAQALRLIPGCRALLRVSHDEHSDC